MSTMNIDESFENIVKSEEDYTPYQEGLTVRKATPEELEQLNMTLGSVRKPTTGQIINREVQRMFDEQKGKKQIMIDLANEGYTLEETARKMGMPLQTASSIANLNGLGKQFKQNKAVKEGATCVTKKAETQKEEKPAVKPVVKEKIKENIQDNQPKEVKGVFEMAEDKVKEIHEKANKDIVKDMLSLARKYDLDFIGGMVVQAILLGHMVEAKSYMDNVMEGIKA